MLKKMTFITMVNNENLYIQSKKSLEKQRKHAFFDFIPVYSDKKGWNAAKSLNYGIEKSKTEWIVCVHQDVVFPLNWIDRISSCLSSVSKQTAVIGLVGLGYNGSYFGHILDAHGHSKWGPMPAKVISIDEHLIILRKSSNLRFDESLPGFHCYGTDICLTAISGGFDAIVVDAPVVHLSGGNINDDSFRIASEWLLKKWGEKVKYVLPTCADIIYKITLFNIPRLFLIKLKRKLRVNWSTFICTCNDVDY